MVEWVAVKGSSVALSVPWTSCPETSQFSSEQQDLVIPLYGWGN